MSVDKYKINSRLSYADIFFTVEKFSVRRQLSKRLVDNISTRDKYKVREARIFLGFDKGYLEKLKTRKKINSTRRIWSRWTRVLYAEKFVMTTDNVLVYTGRFQSDLRVDS